MAINGLTDEVVERVYAELVSEGYFDSFRDDPRNLLVNRKESVSDSNEVPNEQSLPDSGSSSQGGA